METRLDSPSSFFSRQLETIDPVLYTQLFPRLVARDLIPAIGNVGANDLEYTWRKVTTYGKAHILGDKANDQRMSETQGQEETSRIKDITQAFSYTVPEIQAAMSKGVPLDMYKAKGARQAHEEKTDELLAFGSALDTSAGSMRGFINSDDIVPYTTFTPAIKDGGSDRTWLVAGADPAKIISDVTQMVSLLSGQLKQAEGLSESGFTIAMPLTHYSLIGSLPASTLVTRSVLDYLLTNPQIKAIVPWTKLTGAKHSGGGDRIVAYVRDPMVLGALVPMNFNRLPPQYDGLEVKVPCWSRCGGTVIRYPVAMLYCDGV